jgi:hypothetical protein
VKEPPRIVRATWGRIEVAALGSFKDVKLWPGGGREWDWTETGTHHSPGIQPADVAELLAKGVQAVVLGRGMEGVLEVSPAALRAIADAGVQVEAHPTDQAVDVYNRLRVSAAVGGLFHSTC